MVVCRVSEITSQVKSSQAAADQRSEARLTVLLAVLERRSRRALPCAHGAGGECGPPATDVRRALDIRRALRWRSRASGGRHVLARRGVAGLCGGGAGCRQRLQRAGGHLRAPVCERGHAVLRRAALRLSPRQRLHCISDDGRTDRATAHAICTRSGDRTSAQRTRSAGGHSAGDRVHRHTAGFVLGVLTEAQRQDVVPKVHAHVSHRSSHGRCPL